MLNDYAPEALCNDLEDIMRSRWKATIRKHSLASLWTPVHDPGWRYVPTTYIHTTLDRPLYLHSQQWLFQRVRDTGVQPFGTVAFAGRLGIFTLEAGHNPFMSKTTELVMILKSICLEHTQE